MGTSRVNGDFITMAVHCDLIKQAEVSANKNKRLTDNLVLVNNNPIFKQS